MGLKGVSCGLTALALVCGLVAGGLLPSAGSGQPALRRVARLVVAGAAAALVAVQQADRRLLWASLVVLVVLVALAVYAVALLGGQSMLVGLS